MILIGENIHIISKTVRQALEERDENFVKNLAKNGKYYWVITDFEPNYDPTTGKIIEHTAYRMPAPRKAIEVIAPIYAKLLEIEKESGMQASYEYLKGFLEANNTTYEDFVQKLYETGGVWTKIYQGLKKFFGKKVL